MSAEFALQTARLVDPGIEGVYLSKSVEESRRRYYMLRKGDKKRHYFSASVTQIASKQWGDQVSDFESKAMAVSSEVHSAIAADCMGLPGGSEITSQESQNSLDAFRSWRRDAGAGLNILACEAFVWSIPPVDGWGKPGFPKLDIAGTLDLYGEQDGKTVLIDEKALGGPGQSILTYYKLQLAGYSLLLEAIGRPPVDIAKVLILPKDGSPWEEATVWDSPGVRTLWQAAFINVNMLRMSLKLTRTLPVTIRRERVELADDELWQAFAS